MGDKNILLFPLMPNKPLEKKEDALLGKISLSQNKAIDFIENVEFEPELVKFNSQYNPTQASSSTYQKHMIEMASVIIETLQFKDKPKVVEIGCGKGEFLELLIALGIDASGFDTSYDGDNIRIQKRYLRDDEKLSADLLVLRYVLDYVKNPFDFLQKIKKIFGDNTIIYIEGPRFDYTLEQQLFFDICYEQVNYFTEKSMQILFPKAIKNGRCFGQEYQFTMAYLRDLDDRFRVNYESNSWEPVPFESIFPEIINKIKKIEMKALSKSNIYIWGAARKGCMFSWHCYSNGILFDKIKNAVDINSYRHNRFFPGSNLKIISPDDLRRNLSGNDMVLVMNSIYREEIELMISGWGYPDVEIYPV